MVESKAAVQQFHDNHFREAYEPFIRWLRDRPRGFVLSIKTAKGAAMREGNRIHIWEYQARTKA